MKKIAFVITIVLIFSCNQEFKTPEYVIPQNEMVNIITDIHIIDGLFTVNKVRRKFAKDSIEYYNAVFTNYGYTRSDFDTSVNFYSEKIDEYDKIYEEVLNRLNEMETNIKRESAKEQAIKDARKKKMSKKKKKKKIDWNDKRILKEKTI